MRNFSTFIFICCVAGLFAAKTERTWYDADKTRIKEVYSVITKGDSVIKHGNYIIYYPDSIVWQKGKYSKGLLDGVWLDYYEDGTLKQLMPYKKGKLNGVLKYYYPTGQMQQLATYKNDLLNGKVMNYYEDGKIQETVFYADN